MSRRFKVIVADFVFDTMEPERRILGDLADEDVGGKRVANAGCKGGLPLAHLVGGRFGRE